MLMIMLLSRGFERDSSRKGASPIVPTDWMASPPIAALIDRVCPPSGCRIFRGPFELGLGVSNKHDTRARVHVSTKHSIVHLHRRWPSSPAHHPVSLYKSYSKCLLLQEAAGRTMTNLHDTCASCMPPVDSSFPNAYLTATCPPAGEPHASWQHGVHCTRPSPFPGIPLTWWAMWPCRTRLHPRRVPHPPGIPHQDSRATKRLS